MSDFIDVLLGSDDPNTGRYDSFKAYVPFWLLAATGAMERSSASAS